LHEEFDCGTDGTITTQYVHEEVQVEEVEEVELVSSDEEEEDGTYLLKADNFDLQPIEGTNGKFKIENEYVWSDKAFRLPIKVKFDFTFENEGQICPCFSKNKIPFSPLGNSDALSWFMTCNEVDSAYSFMFKMFGVVPENLS
jgi:hypothetical protein